MENENQNARLSTQVIPEGKAVKAAHTSGEWQAMFDYIQRKANQGDSAAAEILALIEKENNEQG